MGTQPKEEFMSVSIVGLDIAKSVFQVHGADDAGNPLIRRQLRRRDVLRFFANLERCVVGIEACHSSHYWARELIALGHDARLIPTQYVKPFRRGGKNDANDAEAICDALSRPSINTVAVKSAEQQAVQSLHRARERLIHQRTNTANQIRSLVAEEGIICAQGIAQLRRCLHDLVADHDGVTPLLRSLVGQFLEQLAALDQWIGELDAKIHELAKQSGVCRQLMRLAGVGPVIATAILGTVGNAHAFKNGRQFAASLGLVPGQRSSGGRTQLLGITKRGDRYLRKLLVQGARAIMRVVGRHDDRQSQWVRQLLTRRHKHVVAVALANKLARTIWALLVKGEQFEMVR
jgi:transposase